MYYYKVTLRLGGNTMNEVQKIVSAPEFLVLRFVHGPDSLTDVTEIKNDPSNFAQEKARLKEKYDMALVKKDQSIDSIFGALGVLPARLPYEDLDFYGIDPREKPSHKVDDHKLPKTEQELQNENKFVPTEEVSVADLME